MLDNTFLVWLTALDIEPLGILLDRTLPCRNDSCTCNIRLRKTSIEHRVDSTFVRENNSDEMDVDDPTRRYSSVYCLNHFRPRRERNKLQEH